MSVMAGSFSSSFPTPSSLWALSASSFLKMPCDEGGKNVVGERGGLWCGCWPSLRLSRIESKPGALFPALARWAALLLSRSWKEGVAPGADWESAPPAGRDPRKDSSALRTSSMDGGGRAPPA
uniref:Uncharacterized protein n=1 Tax=Arundo donax TaxID=35708 RepID=A0A0A8XS17_ARUDO